MKRNFLLIAFAAIAVSLFLSCKHSSNPGPVIPVSSPYTKDMCGPHLFHSTESGNDPSHGSYSKHYDTTLSITYVSDALVYFETTEFKCSAATDTIITYAAVAIPGGGDHFTITYNRYTHGIVVNWGHSYMDPGGVVHMGADSETWTSP